MSTVISHFMGAKLDDPTGIDDLCTDELVKEVLNRIQYSNGIEFVERSKLVALRGFISEELLNRQSSVRGPV
jgi:hypothetical protein